MRFAAFWIDLKCFIQHLHSFRELSFLKQCISQVGVRKYIQGVSLEGFAVILNRIVKLAIRSVNIGGAKISRREIWIVTNSHLKAPQRGLVVALFKILPAELNCV